MDTHRHCNHHLPLLLQPQCKTHTSPAQMNHASQNRQLGHEEMGLALIGDASLVVLRLAQKFRVGEGSRSVCITHAQAEIIGTTIPPAPPPPVALLPPALPPPSPTPTPQAHSSLLSQAQIVGGASTNQNSTVALDHCLPSPPLTQSSTATQPMGFPAPSASSSAQMIVLPAPLAPSFT